MQHPDQLAAFPGPDTEHTNTLMQDIRQQLQLHTVA